MKTRKKNGTPKKVLALLLTLAVALMCLPMGGCGENGYRPLRVFILLNGGTASTFTTEDAVQELKDHLTALGAPADVEIELGERDSNNRNMQLTRIRTEMMAGEGPDVLLTDIAGPYGGLFLEPEKSMELNLFYPLDDYLAAPQFMEPDDMNDAVLSGGKNSEGTQLILPITYSFPLTLFLPTEYAHEPSKTFTWQDMLADEGGAMQIAASPCRITDTEDDFIATAFPELTFGELADYKNKELLFTEETLKTRMEELFSLLDKKMQGAYGDLQCIYVDGMGYDYAGFNRINNVSEGIRTEISEHIENDRFQNQEFAQDPAKLVEQNELTMVPLYNDDSGVTAEVSMFAAINKNTTRPDDAFFVLDALMEKDFVRSAKLFQWSHMSHMSIYDDLMSEDATVVRVGEKKRWALTNSNFENYTKARDCITAVVFAGTLRMTLRELTLSAFETYGGHSDVDLDTLAHFIYTRLKRELSE